MTLYRVLLALLMLTLAASAQAQSFPKLSGRVVDAANLLSPQQEAELTQLSAGIEQASSRQFVIATVPDLQGYEIEDYGYRLGRAWGIGQEGASNGIILLVAPNERKVRIEVGYGLEPIMTDALSGMIVRDTILPRFRDGDMAGGIVAGAGAIAEQMRLPLEAAEQRAKQLTDQRRGSGERRDRDGAGLVAGLFFAAIMVFGLIAAIAGSRRRGRRYRRSGWDGVGEVIVWTAINAALNSRGGGGGGSSWGGGGGGWGGGGGFSGGGGSFGGGGASGSW